MKLLLHIGSHKTATTSIQHFCALNRNTLRKYGYFYPQNKNSAYVFNFLASQIAFGMDEKASKFIQKARSDAEASQCHTLVISAESFYAMTGFFWDMQGKKRPADYWETESSFISKTKEIFTGFDSIKIACYLRPQDEFASSLYNQFVKNTIGIDGTFEDCVTSLKPIFDYNHHIKLWEKSYGQENITVKNFTAAQKTITSDFCDNFLNSNCYTKADKKDFMSNTRLSRDALEYKRIYNRTKPDRASAFVAARCFRDKISMHSRDLPGYQLFCSLADRKKLFGDFSFGNSELADRYKLGNLPCISEQGEPTYPGLLLDTEAEMRLRLYFLMNAPLNRMEIFIRRCARFIMNYLPGGSWMMTPIRILHHNIRLKFLGW